MPRDLPIANSHLLVNFDSNYNLRDIYWPHIGERNHTQGHINHTGVWIDGGFAWFGDDGWKRDLRYEADTLVTHVTMTHDALQVSVECADTVDFDRDVFLRRVRVTNHASRQREIRLFFHHDWHIDESEGANTVLYRPDLAVVIAYKDHHVFLVNGVVGGDDAGAPAEAKAVAESDRGVRHWATGYKEFNGQQGTWRDAEDGELGGNPIAQGSVDSCVGFYLGSAQPGETRTCYTWLVAAERYPVARELNAMILARGPESFITRTHNYWHLWVNTKPLEMADLPAPLIDLYKRSLLLIRTQIDEDGAVVAATDGDVWTFARDSYAYMWPRDGALVTNALAHSGYNEVTNAFFDFCARVMTDDGYLLHKYTPGGALGSSWHPWMDKDGKPELPIQEDETALVVYSLWQHFTLFHEVEFIRPLYRPLVKAAADFMVAFREPHTKLPAPSWDLWEERHGIHSNTVAAVHAGLNAAAEFATIFGESAIAATYQQAAREIKDAALRYLWNAEAGYFLRMINVLPDGTIQPDLTVDSSVTALYKFGMFDVDSDEMQRTMRIVEARLSVKTAVGGFARYENDYYHQVSHDLANVPGNPWFICSCWMAQWQIACAQTPDELQAALPLLEWVRARALPSGVLAEQVDPYTNAPLSVSPLTWSHAEFVSSIRWYIGKYRHLMAQAPMPATTTSHP